MRTALTLGTALLLTLSVTPFAYAGDEVDPPADDASTTSSGDEDVPCYAIDWTMSPPRIYEVPCP